MKNKFSYQKAIEELESIMNKIESGNVGIDELQGLVDQAAKLIAQCKSQLKATAEKIDDTLDNLQE